MESVPGQFRVTCMSELYENYPVCCARYILPIILCSMGGTNTCERGLKRHMKTSRRACGGTHISTKDSRSSHSFQNMKLHNNQK